MVRIILGWAVLLKTCESARRKSVIAHAGPTVGIGLPAVPVCGRSLRTIKMEQTSPPSEMGSWWYKNVGVKLGGSAPEMDSRSGIVDETDILHKTSTKFVKKTLLI